jgi:hypothetical protein
MSDPEVGIFADLTYDQYERIPAVNWSVLRRFRESALHAKTYRDTPPDPSDEMGVGVAAHVFILQGREEFDRRFVVKPEDAPAKRGKKNLDWWEKFTAAAGDREIIGPKELALCAALNQGVLSNARATELLTFPRAQTELTLVWVDQGTGLPCKGRIDILSRLGGATVVGDLKTAQSVSDWAFAAALARYDWAGQLMFYTDGLQTLVPMKGGERVPTFIAVEKDEPYCCRVLELGPASREQARLDWKEYLRRYAEAVKNDRWPGYPDGVIELPRYAFVERPNVGDDVDA